MTNAKKVTPRKKTTKAAASKRKASKAAPLTWKFYAVTIGIFTVSVATVLVISLYAASAIANKLQAERLGRIEAIYSSLNLDSSYIVQDKDVFGAKKPYGGDASRSYSSRVDYIHAAPVRDTVDQLDQKIKEAGFTYIDEPYPGSTFTQYHYKSEKGEYIRLTVVSKPYEDAFYNESVMNKDGDVSDSVFAMDKNAGPSKVTIKVNLDDNNE